MAFHNDPDVPLSHALLEAIRSFPTYREVEHCGARFTVSPFDIYAVCPRCGTRIKMRSFAGDTEFEDVFDAVFEWMSTPAGREAAERRLRQIAEDPD